MSKDFSKAFVIQTSETVIKVLLKTQTSYCPLNIQTNTP